MALTKAHNRMIQASAANVKDFGAVGDGVTDDTAAIQLAFDEGGVIYFPSGTYLISAKLTGTSLYIMGNQATLELADATFGAMEIDGSDNVIEDLIIKGAGTAGQWSNNGVNFGIKFPSYTAKNNTIRNCKITDIVFTGVELKSSYTTVEGCYFENCGYRAVVSYNRFNNILNNQCISCANATSPYQGNVIAVTYNQLDGYNMQTTLGERNVVDGNFISTSKQNGIDTHSGRNLIITNNTINNTDLEAIYLHRVDPAGEGLTDADGRVYGCVVDSNNIYSCLGGITFSSFNVNETVDRLGCYENIVSNNKITDCSANGIVLARGSSRNKIVGNIVSDCEIAMYIFYWSDENYITSNTFIAGSGTNAVVRVNVTGSNTNYCDDNVIESNIIDLQGFNINGIDNNNARYTNIKMNDFLNRGNSYPIEDAEAGTSRQALIVHMPRAYTIVNATVGDMRGEIQYNLLPSAGGTIGWVCTTAGDESVTDGVWKTFGTIAV